jgi:hypothetical protein
VPIRIVEAVEVLPAVEPTPASKTVRPRRAAAKRLTTGGPPDGR